MYGMEAIERCCPRYERAIDLLGKRWTGLLLRVLLCGPRRYCELEAAIPGLSARMLAERLRELEAHGVVQRRVYPEMPVRVEYALTVKGQALRPVVEAIQRWADVWEDAEPAEAAALVLGPARAG